MWSVDTEQAVPERKGGGVATGKPAAPEDYSDVMFATDGAHRPAPKGSIC
jgi:hypothetical protein